MSCMLKGLCLRNPWNHMTLLNGAAWWARLLLKIVLLELRVTANSFALKSDCLEIRFFRSMLSFITAVVCWSHVTCLPDYMGVWITTANKAIWGNASLPTSVSERRCSFHWEQGILTFIECCYSNMSGYVQMSAHSWGWHLVILANFASA